MSSSAPTRIGRGCVDCQQLVLVANEGKCIEEEDVYCSEACEVVATGFTWATSEEEEELRQMALYKNKK